MPFFDFFKPEDKPAPTYKRYRYRTKDGQALCEFSYHKITAGYEVDIHQQPDYVARRTGLSVTHRLSSPREATHKICVEDGFEPQTLKYAQHLSIEWAEYTWVYIKTGSTIDRQIEIKFGTS